MKAHEQILTILAGTTSQQPMQFNALLTISGLLPDTLNMVLDQMYAAHHINQATVTRSGIMQREVWPTGMAKQLNAYAEPSKRVAPTPLPRRNETPAIQPKEVTMNINHDEKTPKTLTILKFIEANPVCNSAQISHSTGIVAPRSYIKAHIKRGKVLVTGEGRCDQYLQLAPGQTAQGIYGNGYTKHAEKPAAITQTALPAFHLSTAVDAQIPVFITQREDEMPAEAAASPKFDTDLGFYTDTVLIAKTSLQQHIDALFMLLPESATICITRNNAQLEIDIEADVFGKTVAKSVQTHEVKETLAALHIVTVEMA